MVSLDLTKNVRNEVPYSMTKQLKALREILIKVALNDTPREQSVFLSLRSKANCMFFLDFMCKCQVPTYLCCPITLGICHDPVISHVGITYEYSTTLDQLEKDKSTCIKIEIVKNDFLS